MIYSSINSSVLSMGSECGCNDCDQTNVLKVTV